MRIVYIYQGPGCSSAGHPMGLSLKGLEMGCPPPGLDGLGAHSLQEFRVRSKPWNAPSPALAPPAPSCGQGLASL